MTVSAEILDRMWQKIEPDVFITRSQFEQALAGWDIQPRYVGDTLAWVTLVSGSEFHFEPLAEGNCMTKAIMREWLCPIVEAHGHVIVKTPKNDVRQHRFNKAVGFLPVGEDEFTIHYRMDTVSAPWLLKR